MTSRERFRETMRFGRPDRPPLLEEGIREDVVERWHGEGLPTGTDLPACFGFDRLERIGVNLEPRPKLDGRPVDDGATEQLRVRLDPMEDSRLPERWAERVEAWRRRDHILALPVHRGFFLSMGVGDWKGFEEAIFSLTDRPAHVQRVMDGFGWFGARLAERVLDQVDVDAAVFSEPIGGNDGPLLSPKLYREVVLKSYRPLLDVLRSHGVETVIFQTYADVWVLIPDLLDAGFTCLWAIEVNSRKVDYLQLRREFGRDLRLIGGIDLDALIAGKEAIRREVETKVPPLLDSGGYLPLADGRVRGTVPWEHYLYYREMLEKLAQRG